MPPLTNPRQELFVQELVKGKSKAQAYEDAGYAPNRHNAAALINTNQHIQDRYRELFDETTPNVIWNREAANLQYTELLMKLKKANKLEAAVKTMDSISRVNGLVIHRSETGKAGEFDALSDEELIELIAEPLGDYRPAGGDPDAE